MIRPSLVCKIIKDLEGKTPRLYKSYHGTKRTDLYIFDIDVSTRAFKKTPR